MAVGSWRQSLLCGSLLGQRVGGSKGDEGQDGDLNELHFDSAVGRLVLDLVFVRLVLM
jgi:hypothetical protein